MGDGADSQRVFSLVRAPRPVGNNTDSTCTTTQADKNSGQLNESEDTIYENLRYRSNSEAFRLNTLPKRSKDKNFGSDGNELYSDELAMDLIYGTIPKRACEKRMRLDRRDSDDTVSSYDGFKSREKAAYRQQLRKSSLIHVSDTNSIPVLEGLRQWASYRRISEEKSQENLHNKKYDTPNGNLNPWITHRRAPKSHPQFPDEWNNFHVSTTHNTLVSPLESFNWDNRENSDHHVPPRKPPPRKSALKKTDKTIVKSPIAILKNDFTNQIDHTEKEPSWVKKQLKGLIGIEDKTEKLEHDRPDGNRVDSERDKKSTFFYCRFITKYPKTAFGKSSVLFRIGLS